MPANIILKALGLSTSPNQLSDKDGSLLLASNIIVRRDNVIEPRRGFEIYGEALGSNGTTCKQLLIYQSQILRHYNTTIDYDTGVLDANGLNIFQALAGSYTEQSPGLRIKSVISNGNLYFTTSAGVKKLSVDQTKPGLTPSTLITQAGGIKAIDLQARLNVYQGQETGFFPQDSQVNYRAVWALNDPNNNLVQGTPSQSYTISNSMLQLLIMDFDKLVSTMDDLNQSGSLFNFGNYVGNPTPVTVTTTMTTTANSNQITVASATGLTPGMRISVVGATSAPVGAIVFSVNGTTLTLNQNATTGTAGTSVTFASPSYEIVSATGGTAALRSNINALAVKMDQNLQWASSTAVGTGTPPLQLLTAGVVVTATPTNLATFTFASGNPSLYMSPGDLINLQGFTTTAGSINGVQTIISVTPSTIAFRPTDTTAASVSGTATVGTIESHSYRSIVNVPAPAAIPTHGDLLNIQTAWQNIVGRIGIETTTVLSTALQTAYINTLQSTTAANVFVDVTVPSDVVTAYNNGIYYFLQLYRSSVATASNVAGSTDILGTTVVANDEDHLIYEGYPTQAQITARVITIPDLTPDTLAGANLYTNEITGEGILQSNDVPPFCLDVNRFENYVFYANTKTRFRQNLNLLGVSNITAGTSTFTITDGVTTNTYTYNTGTYQTRTIACGNHTSIATGAKFDLTTAAGSQQYFVWFDLTGSDTPPVVSGRTAIRVNLNEYIPYTTTTLASAGTAAQIAYKLYQVLSGYPQFGTTVSSSTVTVTNATYGTINSPDGTVNNDVLTNNGFTGWTFTITQIGGGENASNKQFLLSPNVSPSLAVDETARSMVRVINQNANEIVYAYYITGTQLVPGGILLESRSLAGNDFYVLTNGIGSTQIGTSFIPDLSSTNAITNISVANPTVITSAAHGLTSLQQIVISGSNSTPSIDGVYTVTVLTANTFSIPVNVTVMGTAGDFRLATATTLADNEVKPNRVYYSKVSQPEAVPITNYLDVGAETQPILRIFPLRDTLFVMKADGLFRISGTTAPFSESLFDTSCVLRCPDSVAVANNLIYGYTTQGIQTISEAGVSLISRPIDNLVLPLNSGQYTNFQTASWGVGYDSDNAYLFYTVKNVGDTVATICYRFCNLTSTWTTWAKSNTCGIINSLDGKLYMGAGDINNLEVERKNFDRTDYADREYTVNLTAGNFLQSGNVLTLDSTTHAAPGDVLVQNQTLTAYEYNAALQKIDHDPSQAITGNITLNSNTILSASSTTGLAIGQTIYGTGLPLNTTITNIVGSTITVSQVATVTQVAATFNISRYFTTLQAKGGDDMRTDLVALANKLDADPNITGGSYASSIASKTATLTASAITPLVNPVVITSTAHGLVNGRIIRITGANSTPSINGIWPVSILSANTFTIPIEVLLTGSNSFTYTTLDEDFRDIEACYNEAVLNLNSDPKIVSHTFTTITQNTAFETILIAVNQATKQVTVSTPLNFVVGPLTLYKAIPTLHQYTPITMQDPLGYKHMREAQVFFENQAFTSAFVSFASDLQPAFVAVPITGQGVGIYGMGSYGNGYYGGLANSAPFRTYIPRYAQRCRYLLVQFTHNIAREKFSINGITVTGEVSQSTRAYR